jgi:hypothetical protein
LLGCSTVSPPATRTQVNDYAAMYRLARKSRMTSIEIPEKGYVPLTVASDFNVIPQSIDTGNVLALYRQAQTRDAVIDFFINYTQSEEIALTVLYYSDRFKINPFLSFSLVYHESRFKPTAINQNPSSIDRGLFQLNSKTFPQLNNEDFFNIDVNARHGMQHFRWCLERAKGDISTALAIYNAGEGRVLAGNIPESTQAYVKVINSYRSKLADDFKQWLQAWLENEQKVSEV